ncbi:hypothetical protein IU471_19025 [Nocardia elegans]|uniref:hypothetical protein n=1 Tax=Nocardia elegans TaxID=300029 RepID=UPI001893D643|nr:hypothetical protein [Nocardia elegans]MBF6245659.1 hypothetical protein [Nocardia elegans]
MTGQCDGSEREHGRSPGHVPVVAIWTIGTDGEPGFVRTESDPDAHPYLLDADNLRDAAVLAGRIRGDGDVPALPVLRIDTAGIGVTAQSELAFSSSPRLLAGLIADAVRAGVAGGAVLRTDSDTRGADGMLAAVAEHLRTAGLQVAFELTGWQLRENAPLRTH